MQESCLIYHLSTGISNKPACFLMPERILKCCYLGLAQSLAFSLVGAHFTAPRTAVLSSKFLTVLNGNGSEEVH